MEVDSVAEMSGRSKEKHGVKYVKYIGDGDSKTDFLKESSQLILTKVTLSLWRKNVSACAEMYGVTSTEGEER